MNALAYYQITHRTRYRYSEPVAICQNQLRMMPQVISGAAIQSRCYWSKATIHPEPNVLLEHIDYFGNRVISFAIESRHRQLVVLVQSAVSVEQRPLPDEAVEVSWQKLANQVRCGKDSGWFEAQEYLYDSPRVRCSAKFRQYARLAFTEGRPIVDAAIALTKQIHRDFQYDTKATTVNTSTEEAFERRVGVCQDFAHVQIACLRSIGLPAKYVSGYIHTIAPEGRPRLVGADESHAWISLYCGGSVGWIDLDPTTAGVANTSHIPICMGRDYSEVSPMRGVVIGGGTTQLDVSVDVQTLEETEVDKPIIEPSIS